MGFFFQMRVNSAIYLEQGVTAGAAASVRWEVPQLHCRNVTSTISSLYCVKDREFLYAVNCDCDHSYTYSLEILI